MSKTQLIESTGEKSEWKLSLWHTVFQIKKKTELIENAKESAPKFANGIHYQSDS